MIHRLRGILVEKDTEGVLLDVGGVGYRASASVATLRALPSLGEECVIHTRMVVREDAMLLFGFAAPEERVAFDALTAVSKVGPKLALAVLWAMCPSSPPCRGLAERRLSGSCWSSRARISRSSGPSPSSLLTAGVAALTWRRGRRSRASVTRSRRPRRRSTASRPRRAWRSTSRRRCDG